MTGCPDGRCDGSGFLYDEAARTARPCSCRPVRIARKRAAALAGRVPKRYRGVSFDREPVVSIERLHPAVIREVRHYVGHVAERIDAGRGIWFTGGVGTGKTTLAMLISKAAMEADRTVAIYSLPRLLGMLRESYADDARHSLGDLIDQLSAVDLLHIDDVGAEQSSAWVLEQLYTIVNTRYEDNRTILVTTNLITGPDWDRPLRDQIGDRTVSRLWEMCGDPFFMDSAVDKRLPQDPLPPHGGQDHAELRGGRDQSRPQAELESGWDEPAYGEQRRPRPRFAS